MSFGKRLKQLREERNPKIYQKELADAIGVSRQAITMWETGQRIPESETLQKLADFFNCSVDYLLGRTNVRSEIETIAAHRTDDPMDDLPEEARKSLEEFKEYILKKYGKK